MESRNKLAMCRLCLCENECFINVFELNGGQGYIAAEVIVDLLQFQVSETDGYPHVICSKCIVKLTDFKLFKECCQKSKVKYDTMFVSSESTEEHQQEMEFVTVKAEPIFYSDNEDNIQKDVGSNSELCDQDALKEASSQVTIKSEEVIVDTCSEDPVKETEVSCGPILLKYEVLPFCRDSQLQEEELDMSGDDCEVPIEGTNTKVELTLVEKVSHPEYPHCLENKRSHCTSKGEIDADSYNWNVSTSDQSIFEKSKNISLSEEDESSSGTMQRLDGKKILPGETTYIAPRIQQNISVEREVGKKRGMMENDIGDDGKEEGIRERRGRFECFHCGIVLTSKFSLTRHMILHGFGNSYDCAVCGKVFHLNHEFKRHVLTHTDCKQYKCTECSESFSEIGNLRKHMRLHTGSKPYKCEHCGKGFSQNGHLKAHIRTHTGYKPYTCTVCSKTFTENGNLKKHMRTHTGSKPYKRDEYSESCSQYGLLKTRIRSDAGFKPYKCEQCSKTFSQKGHLKSHMRTHTGSKPYKCAVCSKCFSENSNLKKHMRLHTGYKPYICELCGKSFYHNGNLKAHIRAHTGYKPFKCTECSQSFSESGNLKKHMKKHML